MRRIFTRQLFSRSTSGTRQLQTEAPAGIPQALFDLLEPSPLALSVLSGAGRALVSRRPIHQGQRLFQEWPLVCVPALSKQDKICHRCLAALGNDAQSAARPEVQTDGSTHSTHALCFCTPTCYAAAMQEYLPIYLASNLQQLEDECRRVGCVSTV
ncbi:hypothetical protein WJX74_000718 [Apatococcus lobatus]|uniref:Uncharacterized protein n=1 Tax=Apatococcus lobatus TaxID=904363 RepID=A0AAW1QJA8_9CHLO